MGDYRGETRPSALGRTSSKLRTTLIATAGHRNGHRGSILPDSLNSSSMTLEKRASKDSLAPDAQSRRGSLRRLKEEVEKPPHGEGKFPGLKRYPKARAILATVTSINVSKKRTRSRFASRREAPKHSSGELSSLLNKQVSQITMIRRNIKELKMPKSRFKNPGEAKALFKKGVRRAVIFLAWVSVCNEKSNNVERQFKTFTDMVAEIDNEDEYESENLKELKEAGLSFDKNYFKATKEVRLTPEVLAILTLSPDARTDEMCQQVLQRLQAMKIFSDYPLEIQEKLCKAAWYLPLPPKKRIIQEGHFAENFYAVLSGQALVRVTRQDPTTGSDVQQTVARLKKGENFGELAIIYHTLRQETIESASHMQLLVINKDDFLDIFLNTDGTEEADHVRFIKQLAFMKNWPIEKLVGEPTKCLSHFFRPGTIVASDCRNSEWIYIVKSGSVQILKQLQSVKPRSPRRDQVKSVTPVLPRLGTVNPSPRIDTGIPRSRGLSVPTPVSRAMTEFFETSRFREKTEDDINIRPHSTDRHQLVNRQSDRTLRVPNKCERSKKGSKGFTPREGNEERDLFVEAAVLRQGDVIGLDNLPLFLEEENPNVADRTIFSAVSHGAEVVLLSKRFYVQNANTEVKQFIHSEVRPYPDNDSMQDKLQVHVNWDKYKTNLVDDFLRQRRLLLDLGAAV